ncbi:unnamed protein product [Arabis nemorensis]|uniref:Uncharacterized protein n=1 Tax=Arabis nemorensis TaxID=586526 RepID=A0A565C6B8_9BRAS|nr:unnamed protein product [Arabis nemorensis]
MQQETKLGYELDRIPPAVFSTTMTPKQEWSIQSNESLFSIHMGDQSFSTMYKSGELIMYKSGELTNFDYTAPYFNNNNNHLDNKNTLTDAGTKEANITVVVETGPKTANGDGLTNVFKPDPPQPVPVSPTKSYHSETSNTSAASFAFPTLPEYQQDQKTSLNMKCESGITDISRPDQNPGLNLDDPKQGKDGGWLSCFTCFSVKN